MAANKPFNPLDEIEAIKAVKAKKSFRDFVMQAWPILSPSIPYQPGYLHDAICDHMQAVKEGELPRLIINAPPRMGKSTLISILYHCWVWLTVPSANFLFTSFKSSLADDFSLKSQKVVYSDWYQKHFGHIVQFDKSSRKTIEAYDNVATGERRAGVYGSSTGFGPSGISSALIIDDPHNVEGLSDEVRTKDLETFDGGLSTRVQHGAAIIVTAQRLHSNDLSGHLVDRGGYQLCMLPNEFEPERRCTTVGLRTFRYQDPRTQDGALLWAAVCDEATTEAKKLDLKEKYYGQYQQSPVSREGGLIKRDWFKFWTPSTLPESFDEELISCDFSFKDGKKADFNVLQVWKRSGANFYLIDQVRRQMDFVTTVAAFKALCEKHPTVATKLVEDKANGPAVISQLRDKIPGIIPVTPKDSKEARVSAVSPYIEAGNVFIPEFAAWKDQFLLEATTFPLAKNDDVVDALSQALLRFDKTTKSQKVEFIRHRVI